MSSAHALPAPTFGQVPAASVMAECLRLQSEVRPRASFARLIGRSPLSDEARPWYLGAIGEMRVAACLRSLGEGWTVLHSVPVGRRGSDIDHVAVGPAGVFTVNTKFHDNARVWVGSRRLLVNGQKTDHLRNARYEAARTQKILRTATGIDVPVHGVIAVVGARQLTIRDQPEGIAVMRETRLVRWLRKRTVLLNSDQTAAITAAAQSTATWSNEPRPVADVSGFASLRGEVESARRVRLMWGSALLVGLVAVGLPLAIDSYGRLVGG